MNKMTTLIHRNRDNARQLAYANATDFNGVRNQEYALTYNESGSLVSDAGRNIAKIDYDNFSNPVRIQFTNGNVTKYVYSATGEKLRVIHQTAVPNITVAMGSTRELTPSETLYTDSIDYLLGGALTLRNGRIDKFQFDEGYCQAERYTSTKDDFTFCYYDKDHLGNVRQVTELDGSRGGNVIQRNNYYTFGAEFCDGNANTSVQSRKYNGKEFDRMHGLNTYDYGARQYNPVTARWDRVDRFCEKYYNLSPYNYCMNNPGFFVDEQGDSCIILLAPYGANGLGHLAIAIQNKQGKWCLYSKNGTEEVKSGIVGSMGREGDENSSKHNDRGEKKTNSYMDLFTSKSVNPPAKDSNPDAPQNAPEYTEGYIIPTTPEQDAKLRNGVLNIINKDYNLFSSNCAQAVQNSLMSAGLNPGWGMLPRLQVFPSIIGSNRGVYYQYYNTKTRKISK